MIGELNEDLQPLRVYQWGLDLSGSQQGAGGVGGLLSMEEVPTGRVYYYTHDGNDNVQQMVDAATGGIAAQYEYGPFGEALRATGLLADVNPFRFSTKYTDRESGLLYYGYRHYNPDTGRWLNRDPIGEKGGLNENGFIGNDGINMLDLLGLAATREYIFKTNATNNFISGVTIPVPVSFKVAFGCRNGIPYAVNSPLMIQPESTIVSGRQEISVAEAASLLRASPILREILSSGPQIQAHWYADLKIPANPSITKSTIKYDGCACFKVSYGIKLEGQILLKGYLYNIQRVKIDSASRYLDPIV